MDERLNLPLCVTKSLSGASGSDCVFPFCRLANHVVRIMSRNGMIAVSVDRYASVGRKPRPCTFATFSVRKRPTI